MTENGTDLGHVTAMLQQMITMQAEFSHRLSEQAHALAQFRKEVAVKFQNVAAQFANVDAQFRNVNAELRDMRQAVNAYHGSVLGHGILVSELESKVGRIEDRLG